MNVSLESSALASPSTSVVIASDTVGGIDYQRVKVTWGTTGTLTETTTGAGLPIQLTAQSSDLSVRVTSGAVTLSSGTLALGTVTLSSGALDLGVVGSQADVLMYNSATGLTITPSLASLTASATSTTSGNQIVAAPTAGTQIRVVSLFLMTNTAVNLSFGSSAGVAYTGITPLSSNSGYVLPFNPAGWFGASSSTSPLGLYAFLSAAATVGGAVTYVSV